MSAKSLALSLLLLAVALPAQRTIIVDQSHGPGTHYTDLPPAVIVAVHGDTIIVRRGSYRLPAATSQGITILGESGAAINWTAFTPFQFQVSAIPAGRSFVIKGLAIQAPFFSQDGVLKFTACQGTVHLEDVAVSVGPTAQGAHRPSAPAVLFDSCASATLNHCTLKGAPGLAAKNQSRVTASGCTLSGQDATIFGLSFSQSVEAIHVDSAHFTLAGGQATGGNGISGVSAAPAFYAVNSFTTLAGDGTTVLKSGSPNATFGGTTWQGFLTRDPAVQILGGLTGSASVTVQRVPALNGRGAPPGGSVTATLYSPVGDLVIFLASRPAPPVVVPPFGELWLDPLGIFYVDVAFQGASEHWNVSMPIAPFATHGLPIALQGLSGPGLDVRLTNPVVVVLH
jgi:hypothetical protein